MAMIQIDGLKENLGQMSEITYSRVGAAWLQSTDKLLSDNTKLAYAAAFARTETVLGPLPLSKIKNRAVKEYITQVREDYSAATIKIDLAIIKMIVESVTDDDLAPLYPLRINSKAVNIPEIDPEEQNAPCATRADVERALADPTIAGHVAVAAACGLRVSEIIALKIGECPGLDCYDPNGSMEGGIIHVRATLKTKSSRRSVPVPPELRAYLEQDIVNRLHGELLFALPKNSLYNRLEKLELPPMHSYRRFFATVKDEAGCNASAIKRIMGHSKGNDVHAKYSHADKNVDFLRREMLRGGLGFQLPQLR